MSGAALTYVVDASVGIKFFIPELLSEKVDVLFSHLTASPPARFYASDLFSVECANILWKYVRRFGYTASKALADMTELQALTLRATSTAMLIPEALDIALRYFIFAYDASYVTLANCLKIPLVTPLWPTSWRQAQVAQAKRGDLVDQHALSFLLFSNQ